MNTNSRYYVTITVFQDDDTIVSVVGPQWFDSLRAANAWAVSQYEHYTKQGFAVEFRIS